MPHLGFHVPGVGETCGKPGCESGDSVLKRQLAVGPLQFAGKIVCET